jgi:hypothetical protein
MHGMANSMPLSVLLTTSSNGHLTWHSSQHAKQLQLHEQPPEQLILQVPRGVRVV